MISSELEGRLEPNLHDLILGHVKIFEHKIVIIFLPSNLNICFGCSKEPSH